MLLGQLRMFRCVRVKVGVGAVWPACVIVVVLVMFELVSSSGGEWATACVSACLSITVVVYKTTHLLSTIPSL